MPPSTDNRPPQPPQLPPNLPSLALPGGRLIEDEEYTGGRLNNAMLAGANAANIVLEQVAMRGATLLQSRFRSPRLRDLRADDCDLANADWERADGLRVEWRECRLVGFSAAESRWQDVLWRGCNLTLARFRFGDFRTVWFDQCDLTEADFHGAKLSSVRFTRCNLTNVDFSHVKLTGIDLRTSTIEGIKCGPQELTGATVTFVQAAYLAGHFGLVVKEVGEE